jgi:hypothetical protein
MAQRKRRVWDDDEKRRIVAQIEVVAAPAVIDPPVIEPEASKAKIEIVLPTGHRVSVSGAYDLGALCRLVRGLG